MSVSFGIGFTNDCDRACAHCYRPEGAPRYLGLEDVLACLDAFPVGSANLGTGENILNPALPQVLDALHERGIRTSLTSNGLSLRRLDQARLERLHDVEVSFDFPTRQGMDAFRGAGAWDSATAAVERCVGLGLRVTVLAVMMSNNWDQLAEVAGLAARLGAEFRVNVYQPVHSRALLLSWEQFWGGFALLLEAGVLITCTEPVVAALLAWRRGEIEGAAPPCGCGRSSIRLTPSGEILPCVYWPEPAARLEELPGRSGAQILESEQFMACRSVPSACVDCPMVARCGGGCASRRALSGALDEPDPYCPLRGERLPELADRPGPELELLHAANVCTTIVRAG